MAQRRSTWLVTAAALLAAGPLVLAWQAPVQASSPSTETAAADRGEDQASRAARRVPLRARLLPASRLAAASPGSAWTVHRTASHEPETLAATCHRFSMYSVGAMRVAHRSYRAADASGARADHLVASFADRKTAWRAFQVLQAWHESCDELLTGYDRYSVGSLRPVPLALGDARRFELSYGPSAQRPRVDVRDREGLVLVDRRVAVIRMTCPTGLTAPRRDPIVTAVREAAARLI